MIVAFATLAPNVASAGGIMYPAGPAGANGENGDPGAQGKQGIPGPSLTLTVNGKTGPNIELVPSDIGAIPATAEGAAGGVATLDDNGYVPLDQLPLAVQSGLAPQGTWNAATNTPALVSGQGTKGYYYLVSVAGSTALDGISTWDTGDWAIFNGTAWERLSGGEGPTTVSEGGTGQTTAAAARGPNGLEIEGLTTFGDTSYVALATDRTIETAIGTTFSAPRTLALPTAASFNPGQSLKFRDAAFAISSMNTLTIARSNSDTLNNTTSTVLASAGAGLDLVSDGVSRWSFVAAAAATTFGGDMGLGGTAGIVPAPPTGSSAKNYQLSPSGSWGAQILRSYIAGLTLANDATNSGTSIDIMAGVAMSDDQDAMMQLTAALTKSTSAWAVGSGNGGLDTGTVAASTWYHVHLIERVDTGVVDALISLSATSPTMPANYTKKRRIGSIKTDASAHILAFTQIGEKFLWLAPGIDQSNIAISTTQGTLTLSSVPPNVVVDAIIVGRANFPSNAGASCAIGYVGQTSFSASNQAQMINGSAGNSGAAQIQVPVNTSQQVVAIANNPGTLSILTLGWVDARGRFN